MFEISPKIVIHAPVETVWIYMVDIEGWWEQSNPEHIKLKILSTDKEFKKHTNIAIEEKVAGIPCSAFGEVTEYKEYEYVTWEAKALYRYYGLKIKVSEGVRWSIRKNNKDTELEAHVWASFPNGAFGKIVEWFFKNILNGVDKDYRHAMCELQYIKKQVERIAQ